jgi:hypothetical protein
MSEIIFLCDFVLTAHALALIVYSKLSGNV